MKENQIQIILVGVKEQHIEVCEFSLDERAWHSYLLCIGSICILMYKYALLNRPRRYFGYLGR